MASPANPDIWLNSTQCMNLPSAVEKALDSPHKPHLTLGAAAAFLRSFLELGGDASTLWARPWKLKSFGVLPINSFSKAAAGGDGNPADTPAPALECLSLPDLTVERYLGSPAPALTSSTQVLLGTGPTMFQAPLCIKASAATISGQMAASELSVCGGRGAIGTPSRREPGGGRGRHC